jgi:hypothetical protein
MKNPFHNPYLNSRDESNESNYVMIKQCCATVTISNYELIRLNGFISQFRSIHVTIFLISLRSILLINLKR